MSSHYTESTSSEIYLSSLEAMKRNKRLSSHSFYSVAVGNKRVLISGVTAIQDTNPINLNLPDQGEVVGWLSRAHKLLGESSATPGSMISPLKQKLGFVPPLNTGLPFFLACPANFPSVVRCSNNEILVICRLTLGLNP